MAKTRGKILCVADDRALAVRLAKELVKLGFSVTLSYSGQEGLLEIMKATPDLILCDLSMASMTGLEFLERLNEITPRFGKIPLVFLTALADRDNELKGRRLGADDFVTKPIDFDRLVLIINARLASAAHTDRSASATKLNDRQIQALTWVALGKTSAEIARKMHLSKRTVDFHINKARIQLHASTRTEAAIKAVIGGLIKVKVPPC